MYNKGVIKIAPIKKGFNQYEVQDKTTIMFLENKNGEIYKCLIDTEDLQKLIDLDYSWHLGWNENTHSYYVKTSVRYGEKGNRRGTTLRLHQFIMNAKGFVDHKNHNTLDNRKENLCIVGNKQNLLNRHGKNSNNKSGYRNVCWNKWSNKWCVQIMINGKNTILGYFDDVHEAGKFAEEMRIKYYKPIYNNVS